jgi:hypothetical protein
MTQTLGITKAITNLNEAHRCFSLSAATDSSFFLEWQEESTELTALEKDFCDRLRNRYRYYQAEGAITESTVNLILISPLLEFLGLCDPPYKIRGEKYVKIEIEDADTILEGLIDILVVQDSFWLILLESKRYGFSVMQALPQTLAYMMSQPTSNEISFALITTGEDYLFVKLDQQQRQYDVSDKLTLTTRQGNQLYRVMQILKRLIRIGGLGNG